MEIIRIRMTEGRNDSFALELFEKNLEQNIQKYSSVSLTFIIGNFTLDTFTTEIFLLFSFSMETFHLILPAEFSQTFVNESIFS